VRVAAYWLSDMEPGDERRLVSAALSGDMRAFSRLVQLYERRVFTLCQRYLRSSEAEEVAQDTFIKAFTHLRDFDNSRPLGPWLYVIARRQCLDRLRRRKFEGPSLDAQTDDGSTIDVRDDSTEDPATAIDAQTALEHLLQLDEGPREALALFHLHELSYQEIAESLDVPIGTVMTWIHRGRQRLKDALTDPKTHASRSETR
jgi:RNA polymerase sigma-70 factor, ECF subfamily